MGNIVYSTKHSINTQGPFPHKLVSIPTYSYSHISIYQHTLGYRLQHIALNIYIEDKYHH